MLSLTIEIPANEWYSANSRLHWAERNRRKLLVQERTRIIGLNAKNQLGLSSPIFHKCQVTVHTAYPPRAKRYDPGNVAPIVKGIIDQLTRIGYWPDDDSEHLIGPDYRKADHPARPGHHEITLTIKELP